MLNLKSTLKAHRTTSDLLEYLIKKTDNKKTNVGENVTNANLRHCW